MIYTMTSLIGSRLNLRCNLLAPMTRKESWYQTRSETRISGIFFLSSAFVLMPILFAAFSFLRFTVSQLAAKGMENVVSLAPLWKVLTRTFGDHMSSPCPGCCGRDGKCYLCSALGGQAFIVVAVHRVTEKTGLSELDRGIQFVAVNRKSLRWLFLLLYLLLFHQVRVRGDETYFCRMEGFRLLFTSELNLVKFEHLKFDPDIVSICDILLFI